MKNRFLTLFLTAFTVLFSLASATAQNAPATSNPELHENMEALQKSYRDLGMGLRNASVETAPALLDAVQNMQQLSVESKALVPAYPAGSSDAENAVKTLQYRSMMIDTIDTLLQIESALLTGEFDKANELFTALKEKRDQGHEAFRIDD